MGKTFKDEKKYREEDVRWKFKGGRHSKNSKALRRRVHQKLEEIILSDNIEDANTHND